MLMTREPSRCRKRFSFFCLLIYIHTYIPRKECLNRPDGGSLKKQKFLKCGAERATLQLACQDKKERVPDIRGTIKYGIGEAELAGRASGG
jgi:hypothetical protein